MLNVWPFLSPLLSPPTALYVYPHGPLPHAPLASCLSSAAVRQGARASWRSPTTAWPHPEAARTPLSSSTPPPQARHSAQNRSTSGYVPRRRRCCRCRCRCRTRRTRGRGGRPSPRICWMPSEPCATRPPPPPPPPGHGHNLGVRRAQGGHRATACGVAQAKIATEIGFGIHESHRNGGARVALPVAGRAAGIVVDSRPWGN